jgi:hypothetical protein
MKIEHILGRLAALRVYGFQLQDKLSDDFIRLSRDERQISQIVQSVRNGASAPSRLFTADNLLKRHGF